MHFDAGEGRPHAVVLGGGFAGAAAASALAEAGVAVTLLEARPMLGGRTRSFRDGVTRQEVDNGQHLFLGAYRDTRDFLKRLGVEDRLRFDPRLAIPFFSREGRRSLLRPRRLPGPLGLLAGLLAFDELFWRDKISLSYGLLAARFEGNQDHGSATVSDWLRRRRQTPGAQRAFWEPLCYATLNERPDRAAANAFSAVLREGFLKSTAARSLGWATLPLGRLWSIELPAYLKRQGGHVALQQKVLGFRVVDGRVAAVSVEGGESVEADVVVAALPLGDVLEIVPATVRDSLSALENADHSPIAAVNLWFDSPPFAAPLVGFLDLDIQWGFNREVLWGETAAGQVSLVLSAARSHLGRTNEELISLSLKDLERAFPGFHQKPSRASVTWEKRATPSPTPAFWRARPGAETALENLFLAGDWVNVGLPPTIESACRSGHRAASLALAYLRERQEDGCSKPYCSTATA